MKIPTTPQDTEREQQVAEYLSEAHDTRISDDPVHNICAFTENPGKMGLVVAFVSLPDEQVMEMKDAVEDAITKVLGQYTTRRRPI